MSSDIKTTLVLAFANTNKHPNAQIYNAVMRRIETVSTIKPMLNAELNLVGDSVYDTIYESRWIYDDAARDLEIVSEEFPHLVFALYHNHYNGAEESGVLFAHNGKSYYMDAVIVYPKFNPSMLK